MREWKILLGETVVHIKVLLRNPLAAMFTLAFPLLFLVLFNLISGGSEIEILGGIPFAQFLTPAIGVFGLVTATYTNVAISAAIDRDEGILKRLRGTPMPGWVMVTARICGAIVLGVSSVVVMAVVGVVAFDVQLLTERLPTALLVLLVGGATFAALGLALAGVAPNGQTAPPLANATILPLAFISGIFFPIESAPTWLQSVAAWFPLRPLVDAFVDQWNPTAPARFPWAELGEMTVWMLIGVVVAVRSFNWEPRPGGRRRRSRP